MEYAFRFTWIKMGHCAKWVTKRDKTYKVDVIGTYRGGRCIVVGKLGDFNKLSTKVAFW